MRPSNGVGVFAMFQAIRECNDVMVSMYPS